MSRPTRPRMRGIIGFTAALLSMASCSSGADSPALTIPGNAIAVTGTSDCVVVPLSDTFDSDGVEIIEERFTCETEMSDPRATGAEEYPVIITRIVTPGIGGLWTAEGATLTNSEGSWTATGRGTVDLAGVSPLAEGTWPFNYGEVHYTGEGSYEGLTMRLYISGTNYNFALAGWIEEAN